MSREKTPASTETHLQGSIDPTSRGLTCGPQTISLTELQHSRVKGTHDKVPARGGGLEGVRFRQLSWG